MHGHNVDTSPEVATEAYLRHTLGLVPLGRRYYDGTFHDVPVVFTYACIALDRLGLSYLVRPNRFSKNELWVTLYVFSLYSALVVAEQFLQCGIPETALRFALQPSEVLESFAATCLMRTRSVDLEDFVPPVVFERTRSLSLAAALREVRSRG